MNRDANFLQHMLKSDCLAISGCVTLINDFTEAQDSIPMLSRMATAIIASNPRSHPLGSPQVIFISSRSRTKYSCCDRTHVHPIRSRVNTSLHAGFVRIDPYSIEISNRAEYDMEYQQLLIQEVTDAAQKSSCRLVVIECLYSLECVFGIDPVAFVRSVLGCNASLSILLGFPAGWAYDYRVDGLNELADHILDLHDLRTGVAEDVDGTIRISKQEGRWCVVKTSSRYRVTESSFIINT